MVTRPRRHARSDLFALGVLLYRMLTGQMPFGSGGAADVMLERILEGPPPELPCDVPDDLRALTLGLIAAAPPDVPAPMPAALRRMPARYFAPRDIKRNP